MFLQIKAFAPAVPLWLPTTAIFFGIQLLLAWYFNHVLTVPTDDGPVSITQQERKLIIGSLVVGYLFIAAGVIRQYASVELLSMYLFFLAQTMEGAASLRLFKKGIDYISSGGSGSNLLHSVLSRILPRVKYGLLSLFVMMVAISFVVYVLTSGPLVQGTIYDIALAYTLASFAIAALGVAYRLRDTPEVFDRTAKAGIILCLVGAAVYDYQTLSGEFIAYAVGIVGYTVGFWIAALVIIKSSTSPAVAVLRQVTP